MTESAASAVASAVVLDTHALVWLLQGSPRLGPQSRAQIEAAAAISAWEIAMLAARIRRSRADHASGDGTSIRAMIDEGRR